MEIVSNGPFVYEKCPTETIELDFPIDDLLDIDDNDIQVDAEYVERITPTFEDDLQDEFVIEVVSVRRSTPRYW